MTLAASPTAAVSELLAALSQRLDPIIATRLRPHLDDPSSTDWTDILSKLDRAKGRIRHNYSRRDVQCQLRIITERLGGLGYPFDDNLRQVSTVANELRIIRNWWAHNDPLSDLDAVRTADYSVRLLSLLGDTEGATEAKVRRDELIATYAQRTGLTAPVTAPDQAVSVPAQKSVRPSSTIPTSTAPDHRKATGNTRPPSPSASTVTSDRFVYEAWEVVEVGGPEILDALPTKAAKMQVRGVAAEIAEFEGPVSFARLVTLTTRSFGMSRCGKKKRQQVGYQLRQVGLTVDEDDFVWPTDIDPATWTEYLPNSPEVERTFTDISPVEIANAWRIITGQRPRATRDEVRRAVLGAFGVRRAGSKVTPHLARAEALVQR